MSNVRIYGTEENPELVALGKKVAALLEKARVKFDYVLAQLDNRQIAVYTKDEDDVLAELEKAGGIGKRSTLDGSKEIRLDRYYVRISAPGGVSPA
jgi:hypothetical protein